MRRLPLVGAFHTVLDHSIGILLFRYHGGYDARVVPEIGFAECYFQVGMLDMERPAFGRSVIGRIDETHRFEARSREFFRRGRVGRDVGRTQFEPGDCNVAEVRPLGHIGRRRTFLGVYYRRADLACDRKGALDRLFGHDRPFVILIERESDVQRRTQVEFSAEGPRRFDLADERLRVGHHRIGGRDVERNLVDADFAYVGFLIQRKRHGAVGDADARHGEAAAFDARDPEFDDGIRHVVVDARSG